MVKEECRHTEELNPLPDPYSVVQMVCVCTQTPVGLRAKTTLLPLLMDNTVLLLKS